MERSSTSSTRQATTFPFSCVATRGMASQEIQYAFFVVVFVLVVVVVDSES